MRKVETEGGAEGKSMRTRREQKQKNEERKNVPAWKKPWKKTTAIDNDLVFVEASKPAKLKKIGASLCFANAAHRPVAHTVLHKDSIYS